MPAAKQNRSKLAETSSNALPTGLIVAGGKAVAVVLFLVMALLSFVGISTPSLAAQGEQRRLSFFNIRRGIPLSDGAKARAPPYCTVKREPDSMGRR
jgi:hypothetical protein